MKNAVNNGVEATSPTIMSEEPEDLILQGLTGDSDRPTPDEDVEETDDTDTPDDESQEEFSEEELFGDSETDEDETEEITSLADDDEESESDEGDEEEQVEDEEPEWFMVGTHSEYRTSEDAKKGIEAKDTYILELEDLRSTLSEENASLQARLEAYSNFVSEDRMEEMAIQHLLPEDLRGKTDEDFDDQADLKRFWRETEKARTAYQTKKETARKEKQDAASQRERVSKEAGRYVREIATPEFFGVRNPEQRREVVGLLTTKGEDGYTPVDRARLIAEVFGNDQALTYLEGLRLKLQDPDVGEQDTPTSTSKGRKQTRKPSTPPKKVVEKVNKTKMKVKTRVTPAPQNKPRDPLSGKDDLDMIIAGIS